MSVLGSARSAMATLMQSERTTTVEVKEATMQASPVGGEEPDWDNPTLVTTINGRAQPMGAEAQERAGLTSLSNPVTWHLDDVNLIPESHRLYVGTTAYRVVTVDRWEGSHVEAVCEVVDG